TSIFVTHDQTEAMTLGDRIVVMKEGVVQQVGTPLELYRKPANRFVASFIGSPSMNFITVNVTAAADHVLLACQGLQFKLSTARFPGLGARVGRSGCVGLRPPPIRLGTALNANQITFRAPSWSASNSATSSFSPFGSETARSGSRASIRT